MFKTKRKEKKLCNCTMECHSVKKSNKNSLTKTNKKRNTFIQYDQYQLFC